MNTESFESGNVKHLDHFALPAMDLDRAEKFYTEVLGGRVIIKDPDPPDGMFIKLGRQHHLGLFRQRNATIPQRDSLDSYPRVAFVLPANEFEKLSSNVRSASRMAKEIEDEGCNTGSAKQKTLGFMDSEGNILEIFAANGETATRIHHLHFDTINLDESIKFYKSVLNLEPSKRDHGTAVLTIPGNQALVLHQVKELCEVTKTDYNERHFAFSVSDEGFHTIVDRLHKQGIREADELGGGRNRKPGELGTYFKDPINGIYLQLLNSDSSHFCSKHGFKI
jgi:catechol-2,3-dioxygenase